MYLIKEIFKVIIDNLWFGATFDNNFSGSHYHGEAKGIRELIDWYARRFCKVNSQLLDENETVFFLKETKEKKRKFILKIYLFFSHFLSGQKWEKAN